MEIAEQRIQEAFENNSTNLDLARNNLIVVPSEIGNLVNLTYLNLKKNNLTVVPPEIGNLVNLEYLFLYDNNLTVLPPEIGNLVNLTYLNLGYNNLTEFPSEIGNLVNLNCLYIHNNDITDIPKEFYKLSNLRVFEIGKNNISISKQIEIFFKYNGELYIYPLIRSFDKEKRILLNFLLYLYNNQKEEIKELEKRFTDLENKLIYQPNGPGYLEAKEDFEKHQN